jgi:hypothetical protein
MLWLKRCICRAVKGNSLLGNKISDNHHHLTS